MSGVLFVRNHDAETDALLKTDSAVSNASLKISSDSVFSPEYNAAFGGGVCGGLVVMLLATFHLPNV